MGQGGGSSVWFNSHNLFLGICWLEIYRKHEVCVRYNCVILHIRRASQAKLIFKTTPSSSERDMWTCDVELNTLGIWGFSHLLIGLLLNSNTNFFAAYTKFTVLLQLEIKWRASKYRSEWWLTATAPTSDSKRQLASSDRDWHLHFFKRLKSCQAYKHKS